MNSASAALETSQKCACGFVCVQHAARDKAPRIAVMRFVKRFNLIVECKAESENEWFFSDLQLCLNVATYE